MIGEALTTLSCSLEASAASMFLEDGAPLPQLVHKPNMISRRAILSVFAIASASAVDYYPGIDAGSSPSLNQESSNLAGTEWDFTTESAGVEDSNIPLEMNGFSGEDSLPMDADEVGDFDFPTDDFSVQDSQPMDTEGSEIPSQMDDFLAYDVLPPETYASEFPSEVGDLTTDNSLTPDTEGSELPSEADDLSADNSLSIDADGSDFPTVTDDLEFNDLLSRGTYEADASEFPSETTAEVNAGVVISDSIHSLFTILLAVAAL